METKYFINKDTGVIHFLDPESAKRNGKFEFFDSLYLALKKKKYMIEITEEEAKSADFLNRFVQVGQQME